MYGDKQKYVTKPKGRQIKMNGLWYTQSKTLNTKAQRHNKKEEQIEQIYKKKLWFCY